ncbi:hypothetical protein DSECCO2_362140 [anaerobic digester metagenome]
MHAKAQAVANGLHAVLVEARALIRPFGQIVAGLLVGVQRSRPQVRNDFVQDAGVPDGGDVAAGRQG